MRPADEIKNVVQKMSFKAGPEMDKDLWAETSKARDEFQKATLALSQHNIGRVIMRSPITKLAAAAVIIAVVVLGLFEFIDTENKSGVLWAQVAKNVEASQGVIFRTRDIGSRDPNDDWPHAFQIRWRSPAVTRKDQYRGGQIYRTYYFNYDAKITIALDHGPKHYYKEAMSDEQVERMRADKPWTDPQGLVKLFLSLEHHALVQKAIDGVFCEGIEATGPDGSTGQLWVSVETGYPVLIEIEAMNKEGTRGTSTIDQFRWNVDLSAEGVEPEIPADYGPM